MSEQRSNAYVVLDEDGALVLDVTGRWDPAASGAFAEHGIDRLRLNYSHGFAEPNLQFIEGLPLRSLDILDRSLRNVSSIYALSGSLEDLSIEVHETVALQLDQLPRLCAVAAPWDAIKDSLYSLERLRSIITWNYDESDLEPLAQHLLLRRVMIKVAPRLASLTGLGRIERLEQLSIQSARKLTDIDDLSHLVSLKELTLQTCPGIWDVGVVSRLSQLRFLDISAGRLIRSLEPLAAVTTLEELHAWGSTRIEDNDLSPLLGLSQLRDLRLRPRRTYQPPVDDVLDAISSRR